MTLRPVRRSIPACSIVLCCVGVLLIGPRPTYGHNGAAAVARPVDGITIDGDLADWPAELPAYPITRVEYGEPPGSDEDLKGRFRIGYDAAEHALYVAVEVTDESIVLDGSEDASWDAQDGCDIFLDAAHLRGRFPVVQYPVGVVRPDRRSHAHLRGGLPVVAYTRWGDRTQVFGGHPGIEDDVEVGVDRSDTRQVYEWRIPLGGEAESGRSLGFDVSVADKDDDGSFSWTAWGPGTQKRTSPARCGDVLLVGPDTKVGRLAGRVTWKGPPGDTLPLVHIQSCESERQWVRVACDSSGAYSATLPAGAYVLRAVDTPDLRVVETDHVPFRVQAEREVDPGLLEVSRSSGPTDGIAEGSTIGYPGKAWDRHAEAEDAGYSTEKLDEMTRYIVEESNTTGLYVVVDGKVLFEFGDVEELSYVASVRKSILAMLYGKYVENGTIDLETTLEQLHIDDNGGLLPIEKQATVRHLISARSGIYHPSSYSGDDTADAPERGSQKPGDYFLYNNWDFNAAGAVFEMRTGMNVYDALERDLARPVGMQDFDRWKQHKDGDLERSRYPAYPIWLSTRDMARIGYLMLREGHWDGEQVVPKEWVRRIVSIVTPRDELNPNHLRGEDFGYGYMWWPWDGPGAQGSYEGGYTAKGSWGQYITVLPALDLVVAHKTKVAYGRPTTWETYEGILQRIIDARLLDIRITRGE